MLGTFPERIGAKGQASVIDRPRYGIEVRDIARSIEFYRDEIGLSIAGYPGIPDAAILTTPQGERIVLAGPEAPGWPEILAEQYTVLRRGEPIFIADPAFDERLERLSQDGSIAFRLIDRPWGDRRIEVSDPDGYEISFSMIRDLSRDEILELSRMARDGFRAVIEDLSEEERTWRAAPDEWSVREIVHHVADANLTVLHLARVALAEPGRRYNSNPYDQNLYATELRYNDRDDEASLRMLEAMHDVLVSMVETVPDGWSRSVTTSSGSTTELKSLLQMQATHALEHLEQIRDVRRAMGR